MKGLKMLVRISNGTLKEFPDQLAALIFACPFRMDESPALDPDDINIEIHAIIADFEDDDLPSYEAMLDAIRACYSKFGEPTQEDLAIALESIEAYKTQIPEEKIGHADYSFLLVTSKKQTSDGTGYLLP